ncbi:DNA polymerase III subunit gamma and tau [Nakamurella leprariae]|uniref:DNA polymerase III subunit gamma/tau n=1 Tax=Nakamurella leprariae TaxID=2803911 RepID=A0A938YHR6_9ACTN|nr:DNA polymerase III subunit gamma and tau [Nakamurella leprariae]MBM9468063.1 DNA polymerase III subunit gamma and tau [Nakamurella leprariae]
MSLALYRKYRPASFAEVVGQEHVTDPLRTALAAGRVNHAYLFSGPRGCGKTSSARILARSLNCEQGPTPDPCGVCASCVALAPEGPGSLDVVELDAASHGGVDDTRELRDRAFYMPSSSRYRVFIIDEAHMVTTQGFNALLKIVEEPPEHLVFVFATTEPEKVLPTIRSRTHHYPFRLIPPAVLRSLLERLCAQEGVQVEPAVFPLVLQAGGGSARDTLSVLDQLLAGAGADGVTYPAAVALLGVTDAALLDEMVDALAAQDGASVFGAVDRLAEAGHDPRRFAADLLQRFRDLMVVQAVPDAVARGIVAASGHEADAMAAQADRLGPATLSRMAEVLHTGLAEMRGTTAPRLALELMCARMLLPEVSAADVAVLQRLERMERRMAIVGDPAGPGAAQVGTAAAPSTGVRPVRPAVEPTVAARTADPDAPRRGDDRAPRSDTGGRDEDGSRPGGGAPTDHHQAQAGPGTPDRGPSGPARRPAARTAAPDLGLPAPPTLSSLDPPAGRPSAAPERPAAPARDADAADRRGAPERPAAERPDRPEGPSQPRQGRPPAPEDQQPAQQPARPAGPPAGPPGRRDPSTVQVSDVRRVWPEVLAAVKRRRRSSQIFLEGATVSAVDGTTLVLAMGSTGMARRVAEASIAGPLREALVEVLGVDWAVRGEARGDAGGRASTSGRGPQGGPRSGGRSGGTEDIPPPDAPPDDAEPDIPDDYDPDDRSGSGGPVRDPVESAIELLTSRLGARPIEQQE